MTSDEGAPALDFITPDDGFSTPDTGASERTTTPPAGASSDGGADDEADDLDLGLDDGEGDGTGENPDKPQTPADDEFEEIEHAGKKHKVHKDLRPLLMMQGDYTRKTQEVAEHRRGLEQVAQTLQQREAALTQQAEAQQADLQGYVEKHVLEERIAEYEALDWAALERDDPLGAGSHWRAYQQLKDRHGVLAADLQQKQTEAQRQTNERHLTAQREADTARAKRAEDTLRTLQRDIPGWNDEVATQVSSYAIGQGYRPQELMEAVVDPRAFKLLHKAMMFDRAVEKQKASRAAKAAEPAQPLASVPRGRSAQAIAGLDDRLSIDEWNKRRQEQIRARGR